MSVWSDRITASAAFWGITAGLLGNTIPKLLSVSGLIELPVIFVFLGWVLYRAVNRGYLAEEEWPWF